MNKLENSDIDNFLEAKEEFDRSRRILHPLQENVEKIVSDLAMQYFQIYGHRFTGPFYIDHIDFKDYDINVWSSWGQIFDSLSLTDLLQPEIWLEKHRKISNAVAS